MQESTLKRPSCICPALVTSVIALCGYDFMLMAMDCMMAALSKLKFSHDCPGSATICRAHAMSSDLLYVLVCHVHGIFYRSATTAAVEQCCLLVQGHQKEAMQVQWAVFVQSYNAHQWIIGKQMCVTDDV